MTAFDILGDPVRRRILELLRDSDQPSGSISGTIGEEFGISQAAVSQHLKVLRDSGFASSTVDGARRIYHLEAGQLRQVADWLEGFRIFWHSAFDKLAEEVQAENRLK